jgi:RNA polymerase sigma factor (sigma-70 family)
MDMSDTLNNEEFKRLLLSWPAKAIHYLYTFHRDSLLRISQQRIGNRHAAEDVVQEAFVDLWERHLDLGQKKELMIAPYLSATVRNKSVDYNKLTAQRKEYPLANEATGSDEAILGEDDIDILWRLIASLPTREKQCIVMKYFQYMTYEEMAAALGVTIKAVERTMTSARKRLRKYKSVFY